MKLKSGLNNRKSWDQLNKKMKGGIEMGMVKKFLVALVESTEKQNKRNQYAKGKKKAAMDVKHNAAPDRCPSCLNAGNWRLIGTPKKGFSVGKAAAGALLVGPVGVAGGALGKRKKEYVCSNCGFSHVYDK